LSNIVRVLDKVIRPPSLVFHKIGGWLLLVMMLLTAADVFSRNVLNNAILGTIDLTEFMMAIMVTSGLAYVGVLKQHICADVLVTRLPSRPKRIIFLFTDFLGFGLMVLVSWRTFINMKNVYNLGLASNILYIPVYPFVAVVGVGAILLALVLLKDFLELLQGGDK
jgi:TRAP-type C4-dicarboxylate transport system permease small subunit